MLMRRRPFLFLPTTRGHRSRSIDLFNMAQLLVESILASGLARLPPQAASGQYPLHNHNMHKSDTSQSSLNRRRFSRPTRLRNIRLVRCVRRHLPQRRRRYIQPNPTHSHPPRHTSRPRPNHSCLLRSPEIHPHLPSINRHSRRPSFKQPLFRWLPRRLLLLPRPP